MIRAAITGAALLALTGCGVVYTAPNVSSGDTYQNTYGTEFEVRVVSLTHESAEAANLEPYVPPRLPASFKPEMVVSMSEADAMPPNQSSEPLGGSASSIRRGQLPPAVRAGQYRIGVSDVLILALRQAPSLEELPGLITSQSRRQGYVVQDDGSIGIPDAGRVRVAGLTLQEAESAIFDALVAAGIDPAFSLEVSEFNSKRVTVGGLVGTPTVVPITLTPLRLDEAINLAGGFATQLPFATIELSRSGTTYEVSLRRYLSDPSARNLILLDGDSVFVRSASSPDALAFAEGQREAFKDRVDLGAVSRPYAYRTGEVDTPGRYPLPFEGTASLADVLFDDGGINIETGDYGEIYLLRGVKDPEQFGAVTAYHLDAGNAVNLVAASEMQMRPNDVVFVSEQPITSWNRVISQILPQIFLQFTRDFGVTGQ